MKLGTKVLVLGGRGFLGTHLVHSLLQQGAAVRVYDQYQPSKDDPRVEMYSGDFATGDGLSAAISGVDLVYHLISTTLPSTSMADPIADVEGNLIGTLRLLQAMKRMGVGRIVFISSGGIVYGDPAILPVPEDHPLRPLCPYGVIKVAIENYLNMFSQLDGLKATILRVSNPYGSYQHHIGVQGAIPTFFKRAMDGQVIEIWGDGSVVRDYIYVGDVITAMLRAGECERSDTYNIGSGVGHSLNQILDIVRKLTGCKVNVRYLPSREFDVKRTFLDISKVARELDWRPSLTLEDGCAQYWSVITSNEKHQDLWSD